MCFGHGPLESSPCSRLPMGTSEVADGEGKVPIVEMESLPQTKPTAHEPRWGAPVLFSQLVGEE